MKRVAVLMLILLSGIAAFSGELAAVHSPGLEDCLVKKQCRKLVETAFSEQFKTLLIEVEASLPERFFKGAAVFADRRVDSKGHFIRLICPREENQRVCSDANRGLLEERICSLALLKALPLEPGLNERCYDPDTWALSQTGEKVLKRAEKLWPKMKSRMAAIAARSFEGSSR